MYVSVESVLCHTIVLFNITLQKTMKELYWKTNNPGLPDYCCSACLQCLLPASCELQPPPPHWPWGNLWRPHPTLVLPPPPQHAPWLLHAVACPDPVLLLREGGSHCPAANWPNLCAGVYTTDTPGSSCVVAAMEKLETTFFLMSFSDLFLLLGPTAAQARTGEKVVTEMNQQGALQSNYQHKKADATTRHFIYQDTFWKWREKD